ncbi:MAG: hypothetical protein SAJ12_05310 [Jaaginema sp. PMC 1079.18]|nr:hypothetical protein [Jaaginema sp. PMC 1080.18]MEC4850409.1 hypothetical protein [Jaaginema sp. PMC 1079.18]MEC4864745.1 hypothetical protein [Jaaginema sp. PMC 1078.18]
MTQSNGIEQAKQGQPGAIAALMNGQLKSKGIQVKARRKNDDLQMRFLSSKVPQEEQLVAWVHRGLTKLNPLGIERVHIEGWKVGGSRPAWVQTLRLAPSEGDSEAVTPPAQLPPFNFGDRAVQGEAKAIATSINTALSPRKLTSQVRLRDRVLVVTVSGKTAPQARMLKTALQPTIEAHQDRVFDRAILEGKADGEDFITWSQSWDEIGLRVSGRSWRDRLDYKTKLFLAIAGLVLLVLILFTLLIAS